MEYGKWLLELMVKLLGTWSCFIEAVHPVSPLDLYQYIQALQLGNMFVHGQLTVLPFIKFQFVNVTGHQFPENLIINFIQTTVIKFCCSELFQREQ